MSWDYNLVVIGATPEGIYAALTAAHLKVRVALVEQPFAGQLGTAEAIFSRTFTHITRLSQQLETASQAGIERANLSPDIQLTQIQAWARKVSTIISQQHSPAILSSLGVDFISGSGEFCRLPQLAFLVGNRRLRSRSYLLATGSHLSIPKGKGLEAVGYLTPTDFCQSPDLDSLPQQLAILGETPLAMALAQNLRRIGKNVTLIIENKLIFPEEEPEAAILLQSQLEAEGVSLLTASPIAQVRQIEGKKWLQAGDRAIEVDEIILAGEGQANLEGLNLAGVGVNYQPGKIQGNAKLQTTNPRIYICGRVRGKYSFFQFGQFEAKIALKNALFWPWFKVDYNHIPYVIFTDPPLARVGMTEAQARSRYGRDVLTAQQYYKTISQAQILGETTGFCKLIVRRNGKILGAHLVGSEAEELIGIIALAIRHQIKIGQVANLSFPQLTLSEIVQNTALECQRQRLQRNKILQKLLGSLWSWLRAISIE